MYFNLVAWYRLTNNQVCCHVQNHDTGKEKLMNMHKDEAIDRWNIAWDLE